MLNLPCDTLYVPAVPCGTQKQSGFAELYYFLLSDVDVMTLNLAGSAVTALELLGSKAVLIPTVPDSIELTDIGTVNNDAGVTYITQALKANLPNPAGNEARELRQWLYECVGCNAIGFILLNKSSEYLIAVPDPTVLTTKVFGSDRWKNGTQTVASYGRNGANPAAFDLVFSRETTSKGYALPIAASVPTTDFLA